MGSSQVGVPPVIPTIEVEVAGFQGGLGLENLRYFMRVKDEVLKARSVIRLGTRSSRMESPHPA